MDQRLLIQRKWGESGECPNWTLLFQGLTRDWDCWDSGMPRKLVFHSLGNWESCFFHSTLKSSEMETCFVFGYSESFTFLPPLSFPSSSISPAFIKAQSP